MEFQDTGLGLTQLGPTVVTWTVHQEMEKPFFLQLSNKEILQLTKTYVLTLVLQITGHTTVCDITSHTGLQVLILAILFLSQVLVRSLG